MHEWAAHSCVDNDPQNYHTLPGQLTTVHCCMWSVSIDCSASLPTNSRHSSPRPCSMAGRWHFGRSVRPSGWRLSFHISITSVAFCIWTRVWSLPLLRQSSYSLRRSLTPSFNRSRSILKRSERRWAEEGGVATSLSPLARPSLRRSNLGGLKPAMFRFLSVWKLTERH